MNIFKFSVGSEAKRVAVRCVFAIGVVCWANLISLDDLVEVVILMFWVRNPYIFIYLTLIDCLFFIFFPKLNLIYHLFVLLMMHMLHMSCHYWNFLKHRNSHLKCRGLKSLLRKIRGGRLVESR